MSTILDVSVESRPRRFRPRMIQARDLKLGFERILVATDFSEHSKLAIQRALRLQKQFGGVVHLYHLTEVEPQDSRLKRMPLVDLAERMFAEAKVRLDRWVEKFPPEGVRSLIEQGWPATQGSAEAAILAQVKLLQPDLLILGRRGRTRLDYLLLGATTERLLKEAPCPILCV